MKEGNSYLSLSRIQRPFNLWENLHSFSWKCLHFWFWCQVVYGSSTKLSPTAYSYCSLFFHFKSCSHVHGHFQIEKANLCADVFFTYSDSLRF